MSEDKFTDEERRVLKSACKETLRCIHRQEDARLKNVNCQTMIFCTLIDL